MSPPPIAERLAAVREQIADAAVRAGREPAEVTLIGVAKRKPAALVAEAVAAGLTDVGESFAQEARDKIPEVTSLLTERGIAPPRWHFLGGLQRNKARYVARLFDCLHSLDGLPLAEELSKRAAAAGRRLDALVQINVSAEPQKSGIPPAALGALLEACSPLPGLVVRGLMAVPAARPDPESSRAAFARLRELRDAHCRGPNGSALVDLSMGMSADFRVAIEEGATMVRVGTAIFGEREG